MSIKCNKPVKALAVLATMVFAGSALVPAQFPIKLPKVKVEKPKPESPKTNDVPVTDTPGSTYSAARSAAQYGFVTPTSQPLFVRDSIYIQAETHNEYWKMPGQKYSSWVPKTQFTVFYDWKAAMTFVAEYSNPDGSLWFSEDIKTDGPGADRTVLFTSDRDVTFNMRAAKATVATGMYGVKITNKSSGEVVFQGKFKVGKFSRETRNKNEFEYYVDHDWIMPIGTVSFHFSNFSGQDIGVNFPVIVSMWFKKNPGSDHALEARLFYKGQQIATTNRLEGYEDRASGMGNLSAELHHWKRLQFEWFNEKVNVDNGGEYHRDNMPKSFFVDRNPGEYTVKVYEKGIQVREAKFTVGTDGRIVDGGYHKPGYLTYHKVIIPVTVTGDEKWNRSAWRTEAFYGNPLTGFGVP